MDMNSLPYEYQKTSQNGEDGIFHFLNKFVASDINKNFLEFGWGKGIQNNCRNLITELGYKGTGVDLKVQQHFEHTDLRYVCMKIGIKDVDYLLTLEGLMPTVFSLDIDSFDWHLLKAMLDKDFRPKILCHEYNSNFGPDLDFVRDVGVKYDQLTLYGASLNAYAKLLSPHYTFVTVDSRGVNAFWIRKDVNFIMPENSHVYRYLKNNWVAAKDNFNKKLDIIMSEKGWNNLDGN